MRVTVSFPVDNKVRVEPPWPIRLGDRTLVLTCEGGFLQTVGITFHDVSPTLAPKITQDDTRPIPMSLNIQDGYRLKAERDLRAWQSLLAPWSNVHIDFDATSLRYDAETPEEDDLIHIKSFTAARNQPLLRGSDEFSMYGRAFLAIEDAYDTIDRMAFFIEGKRSLEVKRPIDAYNSFYLFFEANYSLPFKLRDAVQALRGVPDFMAGIREVAAEREWKTRAKDMSFKALKASPFNEGGLVEEIVKLRGHLRHNTLSNPNRWDPHQQQAYEMDARFLGALALSVASKDFDKIFDDAYGKEFFRQTKEMNLVTEVHAILTIREEEHIREVGMDLVFPTRTPSASLAKAVLEKVLEEFDERSPGADLFGVRARVKPHGPELFRYDLGPSLPR